MKDLNKKMTDVLKNKGTSHEHDNELISLEDEDFDYRKR